MASFSSIRPLPADAVAQIRSSIAITSLNVAVIELLKNSLDAKSQKIEVTVEYGRGNCTVEDDGLGIPSTEFKDSGGLGKLYYSSKYDSTDATHGSRGSFLASLGALSLVTITSHHHQQRSHNSMSISRSQVIARQIPTSPQQRIFGTNHGTRVAVRDLFGNMPVRVKQRAVESSKQSGGGRDWEELRKWVTALVLAWPSYLFLTVRDGGSSQKLCLRGPRQIQSPEDLQDEKRLVAHVCSTLFQATYISSPDTAKWVYLSASTSSISIRGALSTEPAPTKGAQFLSLGIHPLVFQYEQSFLHEEINRMFENSSFGYDDDLPDYDDEERRRRLRDRRHKGDGFTSKELRVSSKRLDRRPMFFIKVEINDRERHHPNSDAEDLVDDKGGTLTAILVLLRAIIIEFQMKHHFRPKSSRLTCSSGKQDLAYEWSSSNSRPTLNSGGVFNDPVQSYKMDIGSPNNSSVTSFLEGGIKGPLSNRPKLEASEKSKSQRTGSPFDGWSRVKVGVPKMTTDGLKCVSEAKDEDEQNQVEELSPTPGSISNPGSNVELLPDQNGPHIESSDLKLPTNLSYLTRPGLVAKSGKITQPPFSDVLNRPTIIIPTTATTTDDELVEWINPVTKARSLINGRTGVVAKLSKPGKLTNPPSAWSTLGNDNRNTVREGEITLGNASEDQNSRAWIDGIFKNWKNPVFCPADSNIPQFTMSGFGSETKSMSHRHGYSRSQVDINRAFQESSASLVGRISKDALRQAEVISQVDKKFILIKISNRDARSEDCGHKIFRDKLVLVDQHAADERCRVEKLLADLCTPPVIDSRFPGNGSPEPGIATTTLRPPITFVMALREIQLLRTHSQHFADWGLTYDFPCANSSTNGRQECMVSVKTLPPEILQRCKANPKLLAELLRSEAWNCFEKGWKSDAEQSSNDHADFSSKHSWLRKIHNCPRAILDMLNSKSCRGAIMFNDDLSNDQCKVLISRLAECAFPFQCAHGRPSMVPLVDLDTIPQSQKPCADETFQNKESLSKAFERWKRDMKENLTI